MPKPFQSKAESAAPKYVDVPVLTETLFPVDPHTSVVMRPPFPGRAEDEQYRLILPTHAWPKFLQDPNRIQGTCFEFPKYPERPANLYYWHSPDYPTGDSFGWRDPSIPSTFTFFPLLDKSVLRHLAEPLKRALIAFEALLGKDWSLAELKDVSPLLAEFNPDVRRDKLRFFFSTDLTADNAILLTVFLEATSAEIAGRPKMYRNCNKHLHQSFFTQNGIVRRHPDHHGREVEIAGRTEHTAYAKFYLRGWSGDGGGGGAGGISILMHPAQRARLSYEPHNDQEYCKIREYARTIARFSRTRSGRFRHEGNEAAARALGEIELCIQTLSAKVREENSSKEEIELLCKRIRSATRCLPHDSNLQMHGHGRHRKESNFQREIQAFTRAARQVWSMHRKYARHHEAEYRIADDCTGPKRELLFLGILDLLKACIDRTNILSGFRFMLASSQTQRLRLVREDGNIREKIAVLPKVLESRFPVIETRYPVQRVDANGEVSPLFSFQPIDTISLDSGVKHSIPSLESPDDQLLLPFPELPLKIAKASEKPRSHFKKRKRKK